MSITTMRVRARFVLALGLLSAFAVVTAQAQSRNSSRRSSSDSSGQSTDQKLADASGTQRYGSGGRRDPFRPTIGILKGGKSDCSKHVGTSRGVLLDEVELTAIARTPKGGVATFEGGPEKQGYFMYEGDQFCDGTIYKVDYELKLVIVRKKLHNPKQRQLMRNYRDITKRLYPEMEEGSSGSSLKAAMNSRKSGAPAGRNAGAAGHVNRARSTAAGARRR